MDRRQFLSTSAASLATFLAPTVGHASAKPINLFDGCGFPFDLERNITPEVVSAIQNSGYQLIHTTVGTIGKGEHLFEKSMKFIQRMDRQITLYQDSLSKITSKQDVDNSLRNNTTGIIYGFQDTEQLEGNIENIDPFYTAGVRCMQLTYNTENRVGSGCIVKEDKGLKPFGEELVSALNRKNILIDLSHCSIKTTEAALRLSTKPAAITHSGCSALQPHPRNKSDHQLKAMADKGGVVGIYFMPFLRSSGMAQSADVIAHIEHAINVCGEDHVGIGTDNQVTPTTITDEYRKKFNANVRERREKGIGAPNEQEDVFLFIEDLNTTSRFIDLAALLKKRGHSERRVEKIMGGNFRRLFGGVL